MENTSNKRVTINIIANCISFFVNFVINFFLTPYIVEYVGKEIYGFVALGTDFVNYASLISIAINSMASRFITIKIQQKDYESANQYFASVLLSNICICILLAFPAIFIILFLEKFVDIPASNVYDVKVLWSFLFINFFINLMGDVFQIATFAKNRVDLSAKRSIEAYLIKAVILFVSYRFFNPYVWYIGMATVISTIFNVLRNMKYTKELLPKINFSVKNFNKKCLKELFFSGIWNTVSRVGSIILTELDLLLANLLIDASAMGVLSLVKVIPNCIVALISTITNAIMPQLTISYADEKENHSEFIQKVKNEMRILIFINSIVYGIIIAFSDKFYRLWLNLNNQQDIKLMYYLGIITVLDCLVSAIMNVVFNIFTIYNKLKFSSITIIVTGIISLTMTYLVVKFTNLGLYAIAGVSIILVTLRNLFILIPYATKLLKLRWYELYQYILLNILAITITVIIGFIYKNFFQVDSWLTLVLACLFATITMVLANTILVLKKQERDFLRQLICRKNK